MIGNEFFNSKLNKDLNSLEINNSFITIKKIGYEIVRLSAKEIKLILNDNKNVLINFTKKIYFSNKRPFNHIFCNTSIDSKYCTYVDPKRQLLKKMYKYQMYNRLFHSLFNILNELLIEIQYNEHLRNKLTENEILEIKYIVNNKDKFNDKKVKKNYYTALNCLAYNYKEMVQSTWKYIEPPENYCSDDDDLDYEYYDNFLYDLEV
jgi:hypothetical protein